MLTILLNTFYVMFAVFTVDIIWVFYIKAVSESKAWMAASLSMVMYYLSSFVVITYTTNQWYVIPAGIAAFWGTFFAIKLHDKLDKRNNLEI